MFGITTEFPIIYSLLCFALGIIYSFFLYNNTDFLSRKLLILLFVLRTLFVSFISFLLLNPLMSVSKETEEKPIIVLSQDASLSCSSFQDFDKFNELEEMLSKNFDVFSCNYSNEIQEGFTENKEGRNTDISKLMDYIDMKFYGRNLSGVILTSDGACTEGNNPIHHKISRSVPFHTIQVGDASIRKDVKIMDVLHNPTYSLDSEADIEVQIQSENCEGEDLFVKLYDNNKLLQKKKIKVNTNSDFKRVKFSFLNSKVSLNEYKVVIDSLDEEKSSENNTFLFYINVLENRNKILLLSDIIHPDIGAIRSALDNKNYEIDFAKLEDDYILEEYNLIITFYIERNIKDIFTKLENSRSSIFMFVNHKSNFLLNELYLSGKVSGNGLQQESFPSINTNFTKFDLSKDLQDYFLDLPPLISSFGDYSSSISSETLLFQKIGSYVTDKPLIVLDETPDRKIAIVYGEGVWRWRMSDRVPDNFHDNFDEFFYKISNYLLIEEEKNRFTVKFDEKINEGEEIVFKCYYYNESYELNNDKDVSHIIINEYADTLDFMYSKSNQSYYLDNIGSLSPGRYQFESKYNNGEEKESGEFIVVTEKSKESILDADHQLLTQLSAQSNGSSFSSFNVSAIVDTLNNNTLNKTIIHSSEKIKSLINNKLLIIILLLLIFFEWIIRRYNGAY